MARYNGNNAFVEWDGVDISPFWAGEVDMETSVETVDTTSGAGVTGRQRAAGLQDSSFSITVRYDDEDLSDYVGKMKPGTTGTLVYGPEGNAAGKPRFACEMILTSITGPNAGIEYPFVTFELSFEQADVPTATIAEGDTF